MFKNKIPQVNLSSDSDGVVMTTAWQRDGVNKASLMTRDQKAAAICADEIRWQKRAAPGGKTEVSQVKRQKEESK